MAADDSKLTGSDEAINALLTRIMSDKYCKTEHSNFEACVANFVPQGHGDGSFVEQSLQRRGLGKCAPYKELFQKCINDDKKHANIMKQSAKMPECREEQRIFTDCQRRGGQCDREMKEMLVCGFAYIVKRYQKKKNAE